MSNKNNKKTLTLWRGLFLFVRQGFARTSEANIVTVPRFFIYECLTVFGTGAIKIDLL